MMFQYTITSYMKNVPQPSAKLEIHALVYARGSI